MAVMQKRRCARAAFTLIELIIAITIIIILAGLVLGTSGYVQKKSKRSRAEAEIAAISAALESYKADNGMYPTDAQSTENVNPASSPVPTTAIRFVYGELTGDRDFDGTPDADTRTYMLFQPGMLRRPNMSLPPSNSNAISFVRDPFGSPYGYSTAKAASPSGSVGYNPTFDLWSTADSEDPAQWIKNW
jgi:general secretion pathway protein G